MAARGKSWIIALYTISGATALLLQVVWSRVFSQVFGSTVHAMAVVAAMFLLGLAAGSAWAGRRAAPLRPLRAYGLAEGVVGLWALASPWLLNALDRVYGLWVTDHGPWTGMAARLVLGAVFILPPTFAMGASFPWIAAADAQLCGRPRLGFLYGFNTLGAAVGALAAGYLVLPALGRTGSPLLAGVAALVVCAAAFAADRGVGNVDAPLIAPASPEAAGIRWLSPGMCLALTVVTGFVSLSLEIVWTRFLGNILGSNVYSLATVLGMLLLGIGAGGALAQRWGRKAWSLPAGLLWIGAVLCLQVATADRLPNVFLQGIAWGGVSWDTAMRLKFLIGAWVVAMPAAGFGFVFPVVLEGWLRGSAGEAHHSGTFYAVNTAAAVAGSLVTGFFLLPALGMQRLLAWSAAVSFLCAGPVLYYTLLHASGRWKRWAPASLLFAVAAVVPLVQRGWEMPRLVSGVFFTPQAYLIPGKEEPVLDLDPQVAQNHVLLYREGPSISLAVVQTPYGRAFWASGKVGSSDNPFDVRSRRLMGMLPVLLHPAPQDVLVVGLGVAVTAGGAGLHPDVVHLDGLELEPECVAAAESFEHVNGRVLANPAFRLHVADARHYLRVSTQTYDVITSDPFEPFVGGAAVLNTVDYFRLARSRLRPGGLFVHFLPMYGMGREPFLSVLRTFGEAFPRNAVFFSGNDLILIGAAADAAPDVSRLGVFPGGAEAEALRAVGILDGADLQAMYIGDIAGLAPGAAAAPINTEANMYLEFAAPRHIFDGDAAGNNLRLLQGGAWSIAPGAGPGVRAAQEQLVNSYLARQAGRPIVNWQTQSELSIARPGDPYIRAALTDATMMVLAAANASGRNDLARQVAESALGRDPENGQLWLGYAELLFQLDQIPQAEAAFRRAHQLLPVQTSADLRLVQTALLRGDYEGAKRLWDTLPEALRKQPSGEATRAELLFQQGDLSEAYSVMKRLTRRDPGRAAYWTGLGRMYLRGRDPLRARLVLEKGLAKGATPDPAYWRLLAAACGEAGDRAAADRYLAKIGPDLAPPPAASSSQDKSP